ncbi:hypothetical protein D9M72_562430 [compost metagenome]
MGAGAASVNDAFGNTLVIKMRDLFTHDEIFQQRRPTGAGFQSVLVVGHLHALIGTQGLTGGV